MGPQGKGTAEAPGGTDPAGTGSSVEASVAAAEMGAEEMRTEPVGPAGPCKDLLRVGETAGLGGEECWGLTWGFLGSITGCYG